MKKEKEREYTMKNIEIYTTIAMLLRQENLIDPDEQIRFLALLRRNDPVC